MIRDMRVKNQEFKKQIFDNNFCGIIFYNLIQILFCINILFQNFRRFNNINGISLFLSGWVFIFTHRQ